MRRWTADEDAELRELVADGYTHAEIGAELGRTRQGIENRVHHIGCGAGRRGRPDAELRATVLALLRAGLRAKEIAAGIGRHQSCVSRLLSKLAREGLVSRTGRSQSTRWRVTKKWTDAEDVPTELAEWLARGDSNQQIAERVGRDRDTVAKWAADLRTDGTRRR
jgi:DNA-binding NarL/FixJ family response regulator